MSVARLGDSLWLFCPACKERHRISVAKGGWTWDGNVEKPTISPSIMVSWRHGDKEHVCHSFVRNGVWEYLSDCTHDMAGQHVPMEEG